MAWNHTGIDYLTFFSQLDGALAPQAYFEIGTSTGSSVLCFSCDALCVDPIMQVERNVIRQRKRLFFLQMKSDEFFRQHTIRQFLPNGPDIAFLDGMHRFEYLLRDFINTERECHPRSLILLHDCLPNNERMAERAPRLDADEAAGTRFSWTGDVWRMLPILKKYRPELHVVPLDCPPTGLVACMNLDPSSRVLDRNYFDIVAEFLRIDLRDYGLDRLWEEFRPRSSLEILQPPHALHALFTVF